MASGYRALAAALGALLVAAAAPAQRPGDPVLLVEGVPPDAGLATHLRRESLRAHERARDWFGVGWEGAVEVVWVADAEELARRGGPVDTPVAGVARADRGQILLFAPALQARPDRIRPVLLHEFCHLVFARATAGAEVEPPRWLNEGIAMRISGDWDLGLDRRRDQSDLLQDAAAAGSVFPLEELDGSFPGGPFFHVAYAQSESFVAWMAARGGDEALRRYLSLLDEDEDPAPAFERVWGLSLEEAEREWREEIGAGRRLPSATSLLALGWVLLGLALVVRGLLNRRRLKRMPDDELPAPPSP